MAVGLTMAQQIMRQTADGPSSGNAAVPEVFSPADIAKMLNVSEADVIASLAAGDLKGRRIGSQWRVTKSAVEQFLK